MTWIVGYIPRWYTPLQTVTNINNIQAVTTCMIVRRLPTTELNLWSLVLKSKPSPSPSPSHHVHWLSCLSPQGGTLVCTYIFSSFLHAKAATALVRLSQCNSVRPSICLSVTWMDQSKTVQARIWITKSSPSATWKTLVSESVKLFHKLKRSHPERGC